MSPEKMQALLLKLSAIRELGKECAAALGMPDRLIMLPFAPVGQHPADLLLELAKDGPRNPGVLKFVTEHMPEIPEGATPRRIGHYEGKTKAEKTKGRARAATA